VYPSFRTRSIQLPDKPERWVTFKVMRAISDALGVAPESIAEFRRVLQA
jgi:hypothetical protein